MRLINHFQPTKSVYGLVGDTLSDYVLDERVLNEPVLNNHPKY
ncbi:hypothetical protein [Psychrobacter sp.]